MVTRQRQTRLDVFARSFERSRKGNLWRKFDDGGVVTVFPSAKHPDEYTFGVYSDAWGMEYSQETYRTEREALRAILERMEGIE